VRIIQCEALRFYEALHTILWIGADPRGPLFRTIGIGTGRLSAIRPIRLRAKTA
jgi:hypothetical protein